MDLLEIAALRGRVESLKSNGIRPAFSYDRISDEVQSGGISLNFQNSHSSEYARHAALGLAHSFQMVESAHKEGRHTFNEMLDLAIQIGVRDLVFKNTDRMSRNYQDLVRIDKLIDAHGFRIHFYQTGMVITAQSSYNDRFLIGIQLAVAKHASDKISQDVREHNQFKAEKGIAPGRSPYGYRYNAREKRHEIDPVVEASCRFLFDAFDQGELSVQNLRDLLIDKGIRTSTGSDWNKSSLHYTLTNPFYHGEFLYRGKIWQGNQAPYYGKQRYEERRKRMGSLFHGARKRTFDFMLARFLHCVCGRVITGDFKKQRYIYYRHRCADHSLQTYVRQEQILESLDQVMEDIYLEPGFGDFIGKLFREYRRKVTAAGEDPAAKLHEKERRIRARKNRLLDLYASERISREDVEAKIAEHDAELRLLAAGVSVRRDDARILDSIDSVVRCMGQLPEMYRASSVEQKVKIWKWLATGAVLKRDGVSVARIQWKRPFDAFIKFRVKERLRDIVREPFSYAPPPGLEPGT